MKKYLIILVLIGFWGCEEEVENTSIVGAWTLSEVCTFENEGCSGECSSEYSDSTGTYDVTESWIETEGSFSMIFLEDGTGSILFSNEPNEDIFTWVESETYTVSIENEEDLIFNLSNGLLTTNADEGNICFQFTLIKSD